MASFTEITALPAFTMVTTPASSTVTTLVSLLSNVTAPSLPWVSTSSANGASP